MGQVFIVIFLAIAIPAWTIAGIREYSWNVRNEKIRASQEEQRLIMNQILWPTKADIEWVNETFRRRTDETPEQWRDRLLYKQGIAEEFQAIYGDDWEERAVFSENRYQCYGPGWILQGFHNSPLGENNISGRLYLTWNENDAVKALLYSKRGKIPPLPVQYEAHMKIIPYAYTDWNFDNGVRWYRRIEENLRAAGADVTMYFNDNENIDYEYSGGPYFVNSEFRHTRW